MSQRSSFFNRRVQNILGESELDSRITRELLQLAEGAIEQLLSEKDAGVISYQQGYVAALRIAIEKVRLENKRSMVDTFDDDGENG